MVFSQKLTSHYGELKHLAGDSILLMQVGAFMQVMDEDASIVSGVTVLKLQMAGDVDAPVVIRTVILIVDKLPCDSGFPIRKTSWQDATHTGSLLHVRFIMRDAGHWRLSSGRA